MSIRLFDSLSREIRELKPGSSDGVYRFYNCGPTVYGPAHVGNFRAFVINDLIRRLLELEFGPDRVIHVRNLTDVDDKTIRRSHEEKRSLAEVTRQWTDKFHRDCELLNCLPPHIEPKATDHIAEQIEMIAELVRKGHAYRVADGSVYFKVSSFADYGRLSRLRERELRLGSSLKQQARDADEKEDGSDFALWKAWKSEDGDVGWDSPWGRGRPGWHIECSAMSRKHLGDTIDLHTGGVDLLFPHHENEIAQSECCNGVVFARHWFHNEHLLVEGKKMSKSLGNLHTLDDLAETGFSPMAIRYALLAGHPRRPLNFTMESLHAAEKALATLRLYRDRLAPSPDGGEAFGAVLGALNDNLNTPEALGALFTIVNRGSEGATQDGFDRCLFALGLKLDAAPAAEAPAEIVSLAEKRWSAKQNKDWASADALRAEIQAAGWQMLDRKDGYDLQPAKQKP